MQLYSVLPRDDLSIPRRSFVRINVAIEDLFATLKSHGTREKQMTLRNLPCGCVMRWDEDETTIAFCGRHTVDYIRWEGSDREFIKTVATPAKLDRKVFSELQ